MSHKQAKINELQVQINKLNQDLDAHKELLSKHIRARYKTGEYQPMKWVLNQDTPYEISRLLTFYQYLIKSRQHLIDNIHEIHKKIIVGQDVLHSEMQEQQNLHEQLSQDQKKLEQNKLYQKAVLNTLRADIQTNEQQLQEFKRNKANLSRLLKSLVQQSVVQTHVQSQTSFISMRRKLIMPVQCNKNSLEKAKQGVTFYVPEGTPVSAVSAGKVVFSDWLKGYGLLLIIDHGQGFMTLYAHNQALFKQKGSSVYQGEQIASVGHTGGFKQNSLYFEVRQRGKAVSPLDWLS